jgi:hypothetical protein
MVLSLFTYISLLRKNVNFSNPGFKVSIFILGLNNNEWGLIFGLGIWEFIHCAFGNQLKMF